MNLKERLTIEFGEDCFSRVDPSLAFENEARVSALWNQLGQQLGTELPNRSLPEVIRTSRAFPHTRWTSTAVSVVFDQHLIDIFADMTRPMVMPSCPQELAAAYTALTLAERLQLVGRHAVADFFGSLFNAARKDNLDIIELNRAQWQQGDMLVRGQWFFTVAHELVHAILYHQNFLDRMDRQLVGVTPDLLAEVAKFSGDDPEDELKREPVLRFFGEAHRIQEQSPGAIASALKEMLSEHLSDPRFRQEVVCDWLAARATGAEMLHWAPHWMGLATCGLSLIHLATIKQLDSYSQESQRPGDHLGEGALRLVTLRSLLHVRPPGPDTTGYHVSRAFGDVTSAYLDTYAMALRINWSSAIEDAEHRLQYQRRHGVPSGP